MTENGFRRLVLATQSAPRPDRCAACHRVLCSHSDHVWEGRVRERRG